MFYRCGKQIKDRLIKYHRQVQGGLVVRLFIDEKCHDEAFDQVGLKVNIVAENNMVSCDLLKVKRFE